jgi:hypothetical protein
LNTAAKIKVLGVAAKVMAAEKITKNTAEKMTQRILLLRSGFKEK